MNSARPFWSLALVAPLALFGCKSSAPAATDAATPQVSHAAPPPAVPVDPAQAGSITGVVRLRGTAPKPVPIDMSMDPACSLAGTNASEQYVSSKGGLGNVFVYIKTGLPASSAPVGAPPVRIDQHGCRFVPHVAAVQEGGMVEFTNSDPTMHNVHTVTVGGNPGLDVSQGPGSQPQERQFTSPENMISIRCNNHPWMNGFLNVAPNPFFAVTKPDGTFAISGLPPGIYTIAAVHEKLGEQDVQVKVPAHGKDTAELDFKMQ